MTLSPSDSPDWTGIPGSMRFLGLITVTGNGLQTGSLPFTPATYDGAVVLVGDPAQTGGAADNTLTVINLDTGAVTLGSAQLAINDPPMAAPVARVLGPSWEVRADVFLSGVGPPETWHLYVFAVPDYPLVVMQQAINAFRVDIAAASSLVGVPMRGQPVDSQQVAAPAGGAQATITFPAFSSSQGRWVLDLATWSIHNSAATALASTAQVLDQANPIYQNVLAILPTSGSVDRLTIGPGTGLVSQIGNDLVVRFAGVGVANTFQRISASAHLIIA